MDAAPALAAQGPLGGVQRGSGTRSFVQTTEDQDFATVERSSKAEQPRAGCACSHAGPGAARPTPQLDLICVRGPRQQPERVMVGDDQARGGGGRPFGGAPLHPPLPTRPSPARGPPPLRVPIPPRPTPLAPVTTD